MQRTVQGGRLGGRMDVDGKIETARFAGGAGLVTLWGFTLNDWVAIATLVYMLLQIVLLAPKIKAQVLGWFRPKEADVD